MTEKRQRDAMVGLNMRSYRPGRSSTLAKRIPFAVLCFGELVKQFIVERQLGEYFNYPALRCRAVRLTPGSLAARVDR